MKSLRFSSNLLTAALFALAFTSVASAQLDRTWVSSVGMDANPCSRTAPCATFSGAISKTNAGGQINCVDSNDYGPVTITKSISIDCGGTLGAMRVPTATIGISITAGASDEVTIRNIAMVGGSPQNATGISYTSAGAVHLDNVSLSGFGTCVAVQSTSLSLLTVENSTISDCGGSGIFIASNSGMNAAANIDDTRIVNAVAGITAGQFAKVTVTRSVIADGSGPGVTQSGAGSQVFITGSIIASMSTALQSSAGNFIGVSGCTFASNGVVYNQNGGTILSGSDNPAFGNGSAGSTGGSVTKL